MNSSYKGVFLRTCYIPWSPGGPAGPGSPGGHGVHGGAVASSQTLKMTFQNYIQPYIQSKEWYHCFGNSAVFKIGCFCRELCG